MVIGWSGEMIDRESAIREQASAGQLDAAVTAAVRLYGPEIYGFLLALAKDDGDASDAFSDFSERLWKTMSRFGWQCSLRAWCYRLARNALTDVRRGKRRGRVPLSAASELAEKVRTETAQFLRTEAKTELQRIRATLSPEDQELLVLRVDREMSWEDLARVFMGDDDDNDATAIERESARLRKRFQIVKERVRTLMKEKRR